MTLTHRTENELYADWRADRITDAEYRAELNRRGIEHPSDRRIREQVAPISRCSDER